MADKRRLEATNDIVLQIQRIGLCILTQDYNGG